MAKLVSLKTWVLWAIFAFVGVEAIASVFLPYLMAYLPIVAPYADGFVTTRLLALVVWGGIFVLISNFQWFWRVPGLRNILKDRLFPLLAGSWEFTVDSNWPIIDAMRTSAANKGESFDVFKEDAEVPDLSSFKFRAKIRQTWFNTSVEFLGDDGTVIDHSLSLSVELLQETETDPKRVVWVFRQQNKQGAGSKRNLTDEATFLGAAVMRVTENGELTGHYWTNRSWRHGLNAAGVIAGRQTD